MVLTHVPQSQSLLCYRYTNPVHINADFHGDNWFQRQYSSRIHCPWRARKEDNEGQREKHSKKTFGEDPKNAYEREKKMSESHFSPYSTIYYKNFSI